MRPSFLILVLACAPSPAANTGGPDPAQVRTPSPARSSPPGDAPLAWMAADQVVVLPVQNVGLVGTVVMRDSVGNQVSGATAFLRSLFDDGLAEVLSPQLPSGQWIWAQQLAALAARNPTAVQNPAKLSLRGLKTVPTVESQLPSELGSQIRALLAVSGARRYALLPLRLTIKREYEGYDYAYTVTVIAVDARREMVVGVVTRSAVHMPSALEAASQAIYAVRDAIVPRAR